MKPFFLFLLLIGSGILFGILFRPFASLAALCRLPQHGFARLAASRQSFRVGNFAGASGSLQRPFARHAAYLNG